MSAPAKTVALVDPLWIGHHPMYFSQFTASFLRSGIRVIGLCPEPAAAFENLCLALGESYDDLKSRVYYHRLPAGGRSFFNGRFEGDPVRTFSRWKKAADTLADAEAASGMHADLVYFPYLDSFLRFLPFSSVPRFLLNRPWSGLYLRNHHHGERSSPLQLIRRAAKGDAIMRSNLCRGIGVLDERFIPAMEHYLGKEVVAFPDVTQSIVSGPPFPLASSIRAKAAGRTVVGMIGLERRKGFLTLLRVAQLAREQQLPFYFVCAGVISMSQYTPEEREEILQLANDIRDGRIDNLHFDPSSGRIPCESDYNQVFSSFDIAWAAYEGFEGSSGTLSKAAAFEIPCIATSGECVGDRVEAYQLGLTIPEGDAERALDALQQIARGVDDKSLPLQPRFADFREQHSQNRLDRILAELMAGV